MGPEQSLFLLKPLDCLRSLM